jgi:hypothetical protein
LRTQSSRALTSSRYREPSTMRTRPTGAVNRVSTTEASDLAGFTVRPSRPLTRAPVGVRYVACTR